jgi:hypothetical protein
MRQRLIVLTRVVIAAVLLVVALAAPVGDVQASAGSTPEGCVDDPDLAAQHHIVPVPPLSPAYARLARYLSDGPPGRCRFGQSPLILRSAGAYADPACRPTSAQHDLFVGYQNALMDALRLEAANAGIDPARNYYFGRLVEEQLALGDACRGPLFLAVWLDDYRALARCQVARWFGLDLPPVSPSAATAAGPGCRAFPETRQAACGVILDYWEKNGGLAQFGYPLSPPRFEDAPEGGVRLGQWFERARFEVHVDGVGRPFVLLGLLGNEVSRGRRDSGPFRRVADPGDGSWFQETGHSLRGAFRVYWERTGGLPVYGFPISEEFQERNADDGRTYAVQYFERNRFEYHPENVGTPFEVQLGQLGRQVYEHR